MFHNIPQAIRDRMRHLEGLDARDRRDGTPRLQRLRHIETWPVVFEAGEIAVYENTTGIVD